jgi:hypothetical protein
MSLWLPNGDRILSIKNYEVKGMKKFLAILLSMFMVLGLAAGCSSNEDEPGGDGPGGDGPVVERDPNKPDINVWSFTNEIPDAIARYVEMNPDSQVANFNIIPTILTDWDGSFERTIEPALISGNNVPDIYAAEQAFVLKFTQGAFSSYAATYTDLGIENVESKIVEAELAQYAVDAGRRDGAVVGLRFQETGACLIYRRSIAIETWGTDDPEEIAKKTGPGWDKFMEAAAEIKEAGYAIVYGDEDVWQVARDGARQPWIVNNRLIIDPAREAYFHLAKQLYENDYMIGEGAWHEGWFAGMAGTTDPQVFAYIGPAWLINYQISEHASSEGATSFGDWAVTDSPIAWAWGGTWLMGHKDLIGDDASAKRAAVAEILEWITLDTTDDGFQFHFANGTLYQGSAKFPDEAKAFEDGTSAKDAVASQVVMRRSNGELNMTAGQNIFDFFLPAGANARSDHWHEWDREINGMFQEYCRLYYQGEMSFEDAMAAFKLEVHETFEVDID